MLSEPGSSKWINIQLCVEQQSGLVGPSLFKGKYRDEPVSPTLSYRNQSETQERQEGVCIRNAATAIRRLWNKVFVLNSVEGYHSVCYHCVNSFHQREPEAPTARGAGHTDSAAIGKSTHRPESLIKPSLCFFLSFLFIRVPKCVGTNADGEIRDGKIGPLTEGSDKTQWQKHYPHS